jgi:hypothetical protein
MPLNVAKDDAGAFFSTSRKWGTCTASTPGDSGSEQH